MARALRFLLVFAIVAISIGMLWKLGHKDSPDVAEAALAGTWSDAHGALGLRPDGLYWALAIGTSGGATPTECGRWHVTSSTLQMRATWQSEPAGAVRLSQPGFHLGSWQGDPPSTLSLLTAKPQLGSQRTTAAEARTLRRSPSPTADAMDPAARHAFENSCGMHLPD